MAPKKGRKRRLCTLPVDSLVSSYNLRTRNTQYHTDHCNPFNGARSCLPIYIDSGDCEHTCVYCGALFWLSEKVVSKSTAGQPVFSRCCKLGKVVLPSTISPPTAIVSLFSDRSFLDNIRAYNLMFAMTSFGANVDNTVNDGYGPYTFKISGQISHWIGRLCPESASRPRFLQLYIYDSANEVANRMSLYANSSGTNLSAEVVAILAQLLQSVNKYVRLFKTASQIAAEQELEEYGVRLYNNVVDSRYGIPTTDLIGGIISGDDPNASSFDVVVFSKTGRPYRISKLHPAYMPLQYPLIFPYGDPGWSPSMKLRLNNQVSDNALTINMYYCYLIHDRRLIFSLILSAGRLYQQFLVDSYVCIEESRLDYIRTHQNNLRSEYVSGVYDAISRGDTDGRSIGKRVFLPASFVGGPRYMYSHYQDALAISRVFGNPQYFITFTCNVGWAEIKRFMSSHGVLQAQDRPDVIARIFRIKVIEFISFLKTGKPFGDVAAYLYTIEFQKRGLPHCHTLLWVTSSNRIKTPADVDKYISAELPDPVAEEDLYNIISGCMLHGPCGLLNLQAPCMRDGKCNKGFPKAFNSKTFFDKDGYVHYKRRDINSCTTSRGVEVHNGFVVPYNKYLSSRFSAHINVEYCGWNMMIKYLFKYISKGVERVAYSLHPQSDSHRSSSSAGPSNITPESSSNTPTIDEISKYLDGRFICPHEAAWRILNFPIHERHPSVQILSVHLQNMQSSTFRDDHDLQSLTRMANFGRTTLTRWLASNQSDESGRHLTYVEYPSVFRWDLQKKDWIHRTLNKTSSVGRLVHVHPTAGELFYLRMLLCYQVGCQNFEDIRTVNKTVYPSFRLACEAMGLIGDDKEWLTAFQDAARWATSPQLRTLFCHLLVFCDVSNPQHLWDEAWPRMGDDFKHSLASSSRATSQCVSDATHKDFILLELEVILNGCNPPKSLKDYHLPLPSNTAIEVLTNRLILEETSYDRDSLRQQHADLVGKLNVCQRAVYDRIIDDFFQKKQTLLFVYGHGGTGKTFLWSTILAYFRSNGHIILAVAASGIASLLLPSGRTAHSRLSIPIELTNKSVCNIKKRSHLCALLKRTSVIIWDEATMTDRECFECVDRSFRDILEEDAIPFGGMSMLLGGDFRQTLPVKRKKTISEIISSTLPNSVLWKHFTVYKLLSNMRLTSNNSTKASETSISNFSRWLLEVGNGNVGYVDSSAPSISRIIELPDSFSLPASGDNLQSLIAFVYGSSVLHNPSANDLRERAIVCPKNDTASLVNSLVLNYAPGTAVCHYSNDSIIPHTQSTVDMDLLYPLEYLHQLNFPGLPLHKIELKENTPIMLLRNINPRLGLCNGTRLMITRHLDTVVEAVIITGTSTGHRVYIPRITLTHVDSELPFTFVRRQFPFKICYAMTINKSQGQSLNKIGIYLPEPIFTHGQLYVALSRSTSPTSIKVLSLDENGNISNRAKNIVFKEFLRQIDSVEVYIYLYTKLFMMFSFLIKKYNLCLSTIYHYDCDNFYKFNSIMSSITVSDLAYGCPGLPLQLRILRKWNPYYNRSDKWFIGVDKQGEGVALLAEGDDSSYFESTFQLQGCYIISDYTCLETANSQRILRKDIHISVGSASTVSKIDESDSLPKEWFDFGTIEEFHSLITKPKFYPDFIGYFKKYVEPQKSRVPMMHITLSGASGEEVVVTLWKDCLHDTQKFDHLLLDVCDSQSTIAFTNLRPSYYMDRFQLASTDATYVIFNPTSASNLLCLERKPSIAPAPDMKLTLSELQEKKYDEVSVRAWISSYDTDQCWYTAVCSTPGCKKRIAPKAATWFCTSHNIVNMPIFFFSMSGVIADGTSFMSVIFTDQFIQNLVGFNCEKIIVDHGHEERKAIPFPFQKHVMRPYRIIMELTKNSTKDKLSYAATTTSDDPDIQSNEVHELALTSATSSSHVELTGDVSLSETPPPPVSGSKDIASTEETDIANISEKKPSVARQLSFENSPSDNPVLCQDSPPTTVAQTRSHVKRSIAGASQEKQITSKRIHPNK